jgi:4-aminobutyrate aminotransferase-like enzyme
VAQRHRSIAEVRSAGLMVGIELGPDATARARLQAVWRGLLEHGVLTIPSGTRGSVLQLLPPLTITDAQLEHGVAAIDAALGNLN